MAETKQTYQQSSLIKNFINLQIINDSKLTSTIFKSFIIIGIITKIFFSISGISDIHYGRYGQASITIWSYGIIIFSIICAIFVKQLMSTNNNNSQVSFVFKDMHGIFLIIFLIWIISINLNHFKKINSLKIPDNYFMYEGFTTVIIIIHSLFYLFTLGDDTNNEDYIDKIKIMMWLLVFFNFFLILIQQIILDNFSVDIL